ncbi:hypothetical protein MC885_005089 [Smutsia gigantea]|nr:hypothetical protein MC885_005089 [Smutsia gigantea]
MVNWNNQEEAINDLGTLSVEGLAPKAGITSQRTETRFGKGHLCGWDDTGHSHFLLICASMTSKVNLTCCRNRKPNDCNVLMLQPYVHRPARPFPLRKGSARRARYPEPPLSWPFAGGAKGHLLPAAAEDYIRVRVPQKHQDDPHTAQGIPDDYDKKKRMKAFEKKFACHVAVIEHLEYGGVIQPQGDEHKTKLPAEARPAQGGQREARGCRDPTAHFVGNLDPHPTASSPGSALGSLGLLLRAECGHTAAASDREDRGQDQACVTVATAPRAPSFGGHRIYSILPKTDQKCWRTDLHQSGTLPGVYLKQRWPSPTDVVYYKDRKEPAVSEQLWGRTQPNHHRELPAASRHWGLRLPGRPEEQGLGPWHHGCSDRAVEKSHQDSLHRPSQGPSEQLPTHGSSAAVPTKLSGPRRPCTTAALLSPEPCSPAALSAPGPNPTVTALPHPSS